MRRTLTVLLALGAATALLAAADGLLAAEALRIRVQRPLHDDPLVDEAVIRVMGELSALGFDVEVLRRRSDQTQSSKPPALDPGTEGALVFERENYTVIVSAWVSNAGQKVFVETFDTSDPSVTAEVIAVRAVEALRGILIGPTGPPNDPPNPSETTATEEPKDIPARGDAKLPSDDDTHRDRGHARAPDSHSHLDQESWAIVTQVAPAIGLESAGIQTLSIGGDLSVGRGAFYAGVGFDTLLESGELSSSAGTARIQRQRLFGILRAQTIFGGAWQGFLQAGVGVVNYGVDAEAAPGFTATEQEHADLVMVLGAGVRYWFTHGFGLFALGEAAVLPKPVRIRMEERTVGTLGAPFGTLSLGLAARYP